MQFFKARYFIKLLFTTASFAISLSGCMVGPNFRAPASPTVARYTENNLPSKTASTPGIGQSGKSQTFVNGKDIPANWWRVFQSPAIDRLVATGLSNSPNLGASYAALRVAHEALKVQIGNLLFPAFNAGAGAERELFSGAEFGATGDSGQIFNLFNTSVNVSYTLDVFGGSRRELEAYQAQVDYQQFELIAAYLTLTSNIVTTAVTIASLEAQIKVTKELIHSQGNVLKILQDQYRLGGIAEAEVLTQMTLVDQEIATLPPLEKSLSQNKHALSVLVGAFPNGPLPDLDLDSIHLPEKLPVSLPSRLARQRPDVRASEALLHAASAQIGVATANLYPSINITGSYGWESLFASQLFGTSTNTWNIGGQLLQPIFHGGALFAARRQAIAAYEEARDQYKQVVLQAFQNVADSLRALETDARTLNAQRTAETAAFKNLSLTREQYTLGGGTYLLLLNAQQQYENVRIARIQAQAARYTDTVALFQSLGGGWWNKNWCVKECLYYKSFP